MYKNLYRNTKHKYRKEVIVKYTIKFLNDIEETIDKTQLEQLGGFFSAIVNGNFSEKVTRTIDLTKFGIKKDQFINLLNFSNKLQSGKFDRELYKECAPLFNQFTLTAMVEKVSDNLATGTIEDYKTVLACDLDFVQNFDKFFNELSLKNKAPINGMFINMVRDKDYDMCEKMLQLNYKIITDKQTVFVIKSMMEDSNVDIDQLMR